MTACLHSFDVQIPINERQIRKASVFVWWLWEQFSHSSKMLQTKSMLFAVVVLMAVSTTFAIIFGKDATRTQFPYFAYLESYKIAEKPVILHTYSNISTDSMSLTYLYNVNSYCEISKIFIENAEVRSFQINGFSRVPHACITTKSPK